jgi:hypothetical protein
VLSTPVISSARTRPNAASNYYPLPVPGSIPEYGLGEALYQRFPKFESVGFPLINPNALDTTTSPHWITSTDAQREPMASTGRARTRSGCARLRSAPRRRTTISWRGPR